MAIKVLSCFIYYCIKFNDTLLLLLLLLLKENNFNSNSDIQKTQENIHKTQTKKDEDKIQTNKENWFKIHKKYTNSKTTLCNF